MSKRRTRPASGSRAGEAARRRPRDRSMRWLAVVAVIAALGGAAWLLRRMPARPSAPPDPIATMDPRLAYRTALALGARGEHYESLRYYRRALDGAPSVAWAVRRNYAAALNNATLEVWARNGYAAPATRASVERVAMALAALEQRVIARRAAPGQAARLLIEDATTYASWGLPYDALGSCLEASRADSSSGEARAALARLMESLGIGTRTSR